MVTVNSFALRETADGRTFVALELTGGLEIVQSQQTGKFYGTQKRSFLPCTFDEATAERLVGTQLEGEIVKQECDAYEYVNKRTGELMMLNYTYAYQASAGAAIVGHTRVAELEAA